MSDVMLTDFPKIECPFVRKQFEVDVDAWRRHGSRLRLREPRVYLVVDQVNPGFEWVFEDPDTLAVEKLDGTNVKLKTVGGRLVAVQNRKNIIDPLQVCKGNTAIVEGVLHAVATGAIEPDAEQAGEVIGPKLQGNPYELLTHQWISFAEMVHRYTYRSFHEHDKTFANLSSWFEDYLPSRFYLKRARKLGLSGSVPAEGVVFYNLKRRENHQSWMAKLRRDMFSWFYEPDVPIYGYRP